MSKFRKLGLLWCCLAGILILSSYCGIAKAAENTGTIIPHGKKLFTSDGTFVVPDNVTTVWVTLVGGGGGGAKGTKRVMIEGSSRYYKTEKSYSSGGKGASIICQEITVSPGESVPITVGKAGDVFVAGGDSTFGGYISCPGGKAGYTHEDGNANPCSPGEDGGPRYFETCYGTEGSGIPINKNYPRGTNGMVLVEW
jgi:hypothetical protein